MGLEINEKAARVCQQKGFNVITDKMDTLSKRFDAIVAFEVLEHLPNPGEFITHVGKLLSEKGVLILAVPNPESYLKDLDHTLLDMPPHHLTRWSRDSFQHLARRFGLRLIGISNEPLRYEHYSYYLKALAETHHSGPTSSLRRKFGRKLSGILSPALEYFIVPQGYQYHKKVLAGQTHLAELRKV